MSSFCSKGCKPRCRHRSPRTLSHYAATIAAREPRLISRLNLSSFSPWDIHISGNYLGMLQSVIAELLLSLARSLGKCLDFNTAMSLHASFSVFCIFFKIKESIFYFQAFLCNCKDRILFLNDKR